MNGFRDSDAMPSLDDDEEEHGDGDAKSHRSNPAPGQSHHRAHNFMSSNRCQSRLWVGSVGFEGKDGCMVYFPPSGSLFKH